MRKTYEFVSTDMDELDRLLVAGYEQFFGKTVMPGSPERLFISWVEDAIMYERAQNNWTGCQNLPSSAEGEYLDGLAELFYLQERPKPTAATCTMRFYISEPRQTAVLIPAGTRVTDDNAALYWETSADEYVPIGATYTDVQVTCQTVGTAGNDYAVGDIHTAVDIYDYYSGCSNITVSANGSDAPDDEEFYELMRDSQSAWSDAGPIGAYKYFAKRVSTEIADVVANSPSPGTVCLYAPDAHAKIITEATSKALKELEESGQIMSEDRVKELIKESGGGGGGSSGGYYGKYDLTLSVDGWKAVSDSEGEMPYAYTYDAELADCTPELWPSGSATASCFSISNKAGVLNGCETLNGIVRFFSQRIPEADIQAVVTLFGKGGGTGELVIATRDRLGCVKIGDGVEVTKDGVISVHATVSEDQMAATDDVSEMLAEIYDK